MLKLPDPASYWRESEARRVIEAWRQSGESAAAFGRRHGINVKRLRWWTKRLVPNASAISGTQRSASKASTTLVSLVPATVVGAGELAAVIRAPGGIAVELTNATPTQIAAVANALARSAP